MIQKRFYILFISLVLAVAGVSSLLESCQPSCDSIPTEALAQVRILNAVSNADLILVYVDGKLFDSAWYDLETKYYSSNPNHQFGPRSTYLSDGSPIRAGLHQVVARAHLIGAATLITIDSSRILLAGHQQSLIYIGKLNGSPAQRPQLIYTDDALRAEPASDPSFVRFIHAVPDVKDYLDTAGIDVYFASAPHLLGDVPDSGFRMRYGHISHQPAGDNGTGVSPEDYLQLPRVVPGLVVMPIGDTNPGDVMVSFPHSLPTNGLLVTIVVRGERWPVGNEPAASAVVLADNGAYSVPFYIETFRARVVNATRYDSLSLLISNPNDQIPSIPRSTYNTPYPTQQKVLDLTQDSVSQYMGLGVYAPYYTFWFSKSYSPDDTVFRFTTNVSEAHYLKIPPLKLSVPNSFVAIDTIPHNTGTPAIALMELFDTVSNPEISGQGRVRFVNTTADYTANFTVAGKNFSLSQRQVAYADMLAGNYSIQVNGSTVNVPVQSFAPITVFFMPSTPGNPVPYRISTP